jgi:mono/diheme cytochrome c family protein
MFAALPIAVVLALGASAQERRHDEPVESILASVPDRARVKLNPLESDSEAAAGGKKLFEQHCAECHGETGAGSRRGPSLRANGMERATAGELFWILTNGVVRKGMPPWAKLPEQQRWQIVAFLRAGGR